MEKGSATMLGRWPWREPSGLIRTSIQTDNWNRSTSSKPTASRRASAIFDESGAGRGESDQRTQLSSTHRNHSVPRRESSIERSAMPLSDFPPGVMTGEADSICQPHTITHTQEVFKWLNRAYGRHSCEWMR